MQGALCYELMLENGAGWGDTNFDEAEKAEAKRLIKFAEATCDEDDVEACLAAVNAHLATVVSFFYGPL